MTPKGANAGAVENQAPTGRFHCYERLDLEEEKRILARFQSDGDSRDANGEFMEICVL